MITMKHLIKVSAALTLIMSLGLSACKKMDADKNTVDKTNYEELSKQIAVGIYNSLKFENSTVQTNSANQLRTNSTFSDYPLYPKCGDIVVFPTVHSVENIGDTTRTTTSNRVHTYICNNSQLNEYSLADTVTTRAIAGFYRSVYTATQNYNTRNDSLIFAVPMPFQPSAVSNGQIAVGYTQVKYNNSNITTDSLAWATRYTLNNVLTKTIFNETASFIFTPGGFMCACAPPMYTKRRIVGGQASFTASAYHKDNLTDAGGVKQEHTGLITFINAYTSRVTFFAGGFSGTYEIKIQPVTTDNTEVHDVITVKKL